MTFRKCGSRPIQNSTVSINMGSGITVGLAVTSHNPSAVSTAIFDSVTISTPVPAQPTKTPIPAQPTSTPIPAQPTKTPVPAQPTNTPVPASGAHISLSSTMLSPGFPEAIYGSGFPASSRVIILLDGVQLGYPNQVDGNGRFIATFILSTNASHGFHIVTASDNGVSVTAPLYVS